MKNESISEKKASSSSHADHTFLIGEKGLEEGRAVNRKLDGVLEEEASSAHGDLRMGEGENTWRKISLFRHRTKEPPQKQEKGTNDLQVDSKDDGEKFHRAVHGQGHALRQVIPKPHGG